LQREASVLLIRPAAQASPQTVLPMAKAFKV